MKSNLLVQSAKHLGSSEGVQIATIRTLSTFFVVDKVMIYHLRTIAMWRPHFSRTRWLYSLVVVPFGSTLWSNSLVVPYRTLSLASGREMITSSRRPFASWRWASDFKRLRNISKDNERSSSPQAILKRFQTLGFPKQKRLLNGETQLAGSEMPLPNLPYRQYARIECSYRVFISSVQMECSYRICFRTIVQYAHIEYTHILISNMVQWIVRTIQRSGIEHSSEFGTHRLRAGCASKAT